MRAPLLARAEEAIKYEYETAMKECSEALKLAMNKENPSATVSAIRLRAELRGLLIERKEVGKPGEFSDLTDKELDEELARVEARGPIDP